MHRPHTLKAETKSCLCLLQVQAYGQSMCIPPKNKRNYEDAVRFHFWLRVYLNTDREKASNSLESISSSMEVTLTIS